MKAQQILLFLGIGALFAIPGYTLGYAVASERLIHFFAASGRGEWERGVVES
jgi:hypothetical protein